MKTKNKYIKWTICSLVCILFSIASIQAQNYTDAEIGFDKQASRDALLLDGADINNIDNILSVYRYRLVTRYERSQSSQNGFTPIISDGCGNVGFTQEFDEWTYSVGLNTGNNPIVYNDIEGIDDDSYIYLTSEIESGSLDQNNIPLDMPATIPITAAQLQLSRFGHNVIRLGNTETLSGAERIEKTITVTEQNKIFGYRYAVVLEEASNDHPLDKQPYFSVRIEDENGEIDCSTFRASVPATVDSADGIPGFINAGLENSNIGNGIIWYRPVSTNILDLTDHIGDTLTIIVEVADCGQSGHYGYAFFEAFCGGDDDVIQATSNGEGYCANTNITFTSAQDTFGTAEWTVIGPGGPSGPYNAEQFNYYFDTIGEYTIQLTITPLGGATSGCELVFTRQISVIDCNCIECQNCSSFSPIPGKKYVLSGWVLEEHAAQQISYNETAIDVLFKNEFGEPLNSGGVISFLPAGEIIDGWQRILAEFTIPDVAKNISIDLVNNSNTINAFFDDIRVHPFNGNMKSFVYDQQTQRLMAELDENNYATYYEYDSEGGLVRVKKETTRGIYTIQETRSGNSTLNN